MWARRQRLPPGPKVVLLMLADAADPERGECWPSVRWLEEATSLSDRSIQRHVSRLRDLGLIEVEERYGHKGRQTSNLFRLRLHGAAQGLGEGDRLSPGGDVAVTPPVTVVSPHETTTGISQRTDEREGAREAEKGVSAPDAREVGGDVGSADVAFVRLMTAWPTAAVDDREAGWAAWGRLGLDDRHSAVAAVAAYLAEERRCGRTLTCSVATYLAQRRWQHLKAPAPAESKPALVALAPYSRPWCAELHRRAASDATLRSARTMVSLGTSTTVRASEAPDERTCSGLVRVPVRGDDFRAWRVWFEARGIRLAATDLPPEFWAPSLRPPVTGGERAA